ncbi:MAG: binding-protein-dependent transport system inner membrane component [uncultured bacterium]|nr:MAG: binding-protein-dependent transport system inner membrane component [uncultured bacterium]
MSQTMLFLLLDATFETLYMVVAASAITAFIGLPLGTLLYVTRKNHIFEYPMVHEILAILVNITRSIPFVILMIAVIPFTRFLVGSSIGTNAAIVPLSLCAIPFFARIVENALLKVNEGLIEAATAMGATVWQIITKVLIKEALSSIIQGLTLTMISLVGYSAMAGAVGGGGLGDLAIRYGYQRFNTSVMLITIVIMVVIVQLIQYSGDKIAKRFHPIKS